MDFIKLAQIIAVGASGFALGCYFGFRYHFKLIQIKLKQLYSLADELKKRNNKFLKNISEAYNYINGNEGKLTDMDIFLMDKWID